MRDREGTEKRELGGGKRNANKYISLASLNFDALLKTMKIFYTALSQHLPN